METHYQSRRISLLTLVCSDSHGLEGLVPKNNVLNDLKTSNLKTLYVESREIRVNMKLCLEITDNNHSSKPIHHAILSKHIHD